MSGFLATLSLSVGLSTFGFSPEKKTKIYYCAAQIMTSKLKTAVSDYRNIAVFHFFLIKLVDVKAC